jgi:hypothetical protein
VIRLFLVLVLLSGFALAHQPRFPDQGMTEVRNPEVSQAFYAELKGEPDLYCITDEDSFQLYVQLLVPDIPNVTRDYMAEVFTRTDSGRQFIAKLDGPAAEWTEFYEPFAGDNYFTGPEFSTRVGPGDCFVEVTSPDNLGKYVLVVGQAESFPPGEIVRTLGMMPKLKKDYFGKPAYTACFNYIGACIGVGTVVVVGIVVGIVLLARR